MKILAIIPARGGSKGITRKNTREVAGKPLIAWTIEAALAAKGLDRIVVSTDDDEIASVSRQYGADIPFMRPEELGGDDITTLAVLQHVLARLEADDVYVPDAVMTLQPTSPLRTSRHIEEAIEMFVADPKADSLVSCLAVPHIYHPESVMKSDPNGYLRPYFDRPQPTRRQDKPTAYARNGAAIYLTRTACLSRFIFGGNLMAYLMDETSSLDIDTEDDLVRADEILSRNAR